MQAVILAAGDGGRLAPITFFQPKPLVKVGGRPMLDYTVEALEKAEIKDIIIVVGYRAWQISDYISQEAAYSAKVLLVYNPHYEKGNALSLLSCHRYVYSSSFVLAMADHLFSPKLVRKALQQAHSSGNFLAVDCKPEPRIVEEATKVLVDEGKNIKAVGKNLERFNAIDTGFFILTHEIFTAIREVLAEKGDCELSEALNYLINHGSGLKACDVSGCFWTDVDTFEDLSWAEMKLSKEGKNARRIYIPAFEPKAFKAIGSPSCSDTPYPQLRKLFKLYYGNRSGFSLPKRPEHFGGHFGPDNFSNGRS